MNNTLWTADLNSYPKSNLKLSLRCKTHYAYPEETTAHGGTKTGETKEMAQSNTLLANLFSDIADILFLNKHEDKFYSWWKPDTE